MEDTDHICDDVVKVNGMTHLLFQDPGENMCTGNLVQEVYQNFGKIQESSHALVGLLKKKYKKSVKLSKESVKLSEESVKLVKLREEIGFLITFCWSALMWIFEEEDSTMLKDSSVRLLQEIEFQLLDLVNECNIQLSGALNISKLILFSEMKDMMQRIEEAYSEQSSICSHLLNFDLILEYLDQINYDLEWVLRSCREGDERGYAIRLQSKFVLLRRYLKFLTENLKHGDDLGEALIAVANVSYMLASRSFLVIMCECAPQNHIIKSIDISLGVLKALVLLSDGSYSTLLMRNELLISYVECVQEKLLELLENDAVDLADILKDQVKIIHNRHQYLMHLHIGYLAKHNPEQKGLFNIKEGLTSIRLGFQTVTWNLGYAICLYYEDPNIEILSTTLGDLIQEVDRIKDITIYAICCIALNKACEITPKEDQLGSLILLLQNLKKIMDDKPDLVVNLKDHENLVLFIFYLIKNNIRGTNITRTDVWKTKTIIDESKKERSFLKKQVELDSVVDEEFSQNILDQLDITLINHEEVNKVLLSAQVVAFRMACYSLLARYGRRFAWWDLYLGCKDRVGILKAVVLSLADTSAPSLTNTHVECIGDNLIELLRDEAFSSLKEQLNILHEGLLYLARLLITYPQDNDKQEKLSKTRFDFLALTKIVGSFICSCYENPKIEEKRSVLIDLIEKIDLIREETVKTICCIVLERSCPENGQLGSLILLLQKLDKFMDLNPNVIVSWMDHENLVLFMFYLQTNIVGGYSIVNDELCQDTVDQLDVNMISYEELNGVLMSAQVFAFKMACYSAARRYGKLRWWELCLGMKYRVDSHMRVNILKLLVFSLEHASPTTLLDDTLMNAYVSCIKDNLDKLLKDNPFSALTRPLKLLQWHFLFLVRFHASFKDDQEKPLHIKVHLLEFLRKLGSVICSFFNNLSTNRGTELSDLYENLNLIKTEIKEFLHLAHINKIRHESPKTDQLGALNSLLEKMGSLMDCKTDLFNTWKDRFQMIHKKMVLCQSLITSSSARDDEWKFLCNRITDAGYAAEYLLTSFAGEACPISCTALWMSEVTEHVELIETEAKVKFGICKEVTTGIKYDGIKYDSHGSSQALLVPTLTDIVVGFDGEINLIKVKLASKYTGLDVISIIGTPGLGKTTLARKVFEDPSIASRFVRVWFCVSQQYSKKQFFLTILASFGKVTDQIKETSTEELSDMVHRELMGRRYLIVLDDIWDIDAFDELKIFLPDANKGSRIILTSRHTEIGLKAKLESDPIVPKELTDIESWSLLKQKVYNNEECPPEFNDIGMVIAQKCRGLPLAVVLVGGILAKLAKTLAMWEQVAENLRSYRATDSKSQWMPALELSYKYLPDCLKPLFLYFGAFPEDEEIPADKLICLWMAEGFVQMTESHGSLEIQAEVHLKELIDRSLVRVTRRRWDGRAKTCHVHDLLHDMCLEKMKEENFMQQLNGNSEIPVPIMYQRRLSLVFTRWNKTRTSSMHIAACQDLPMFSITPPIYSLLFFRVGSTGMLANGEINRVLSSLKLLRVLYADIFSIEDNQAYDSLFMLSHLIFLSITVCETIPSSVSRLHRLETLIIKSPSMRNFDVPETIWEMGKLRHLHIIASIGKVKFSIAPENPYILKNVETLSKPCIDFGEEEKFFRKLPGLKKLNCLFSKGINYDPESQDFPNLESLGKLEILRVGLDTMDHNPGVVKFSGRFKLPLMLKKLSICEFRLEWNHISMFMELKNLEVLKLSNHAVEGECWDMGEEDEFSQLQVLKLKNLNIGKWFACAENFPNLKKLVLERCYKIEEIPSDLGEFDNLEKIEVIECSEYVLEMAEEIGTKLKVDGIDLPKVFTTSQGKRVNIN